MTETVVVLGAGYGGAGAITRLEELLPDADLVWVSERDHHLVRHEVHRVVRDPAVQTHVTIPVEEIASPDTTFVEATATGIDTDDRVLHLNDGDRIEYDYALVATGSETAFFDIPGLADRALPLVDIDDALDVHRAVVEAAEGATPADPARIVVGGAGLSGIQTAGELAALRDERDLPVQVNLLEALETVLPAGHPAVRERLGRLLLDAEVAVRTGHPVVEVDDDVIRFERGPPQSYDVLVWTGGITGRPYLADSGLADEQDRVPARSTFETSDERVFAVGDAALVQQADGVAPPTAQAAWDAAGVAAENAARTIEGRPLREWTHDDRGTLVSVGDRAVAHDVPVSPVRTFGGRPAELLKKAAAARWIASIASTRRAVAAWRCL